MDYDLPNRSWMRDELARDNQLRRELDEATPSVGSAGFVISAVILVILGVVFFGPPVGDSTTSVPSRATIEAPAPTTPPGNQ